MEAPLFVEFETGEDGMIIATIPTLPGLVTQGKDWDEVHSNIVDAVKGWLETDYRERLLERTGKAMCGFVTIKMDDALHPRPTLRTVATKEIKFGEC